MAKVRIVKRDGTPTPYFWSNKHTCDRNFLTVYKETTDGVKRIKGVHYDATKNRMIKPD